MRTRRRITSNSLRSGTRRGRSARPLHHSIGGRPCRKIRVPWTGRKLSLPSRTKAPAPITHSSMIFAPFMMMLPMPTRLPHQFMQPCRNAMCPIVQSSPIVSGKPGPVCETDPSCTFERAPTVISSLSPRRTGPNQTLASSSSLTLPKRMAF